MSKFTTIYNNFAGGKVSEKFKGRSDTKIYHSSLAELRNFLIGKIGGLYKRTSTVLVHDLSNISAGFKDTHTSISFDTGRGFTYTVFLPHATVKLDGGASNEVYIILNDGLGISAPTQYFLGSGITARVDAALPAWQLTVATPFTEGHWVWQQVGDLLFLTHTSGIQRPLVLARTSPSTFELNYFDSYQTEFEKFSRILKVPYMKNKSSITMAISGTTMTASAAYFTAGMIGSLIRINIGSVSDVAVITAFASSTSVTVSYLLGATPSSATDDWDISSWNDEWGYPTSVTFHEQRLFWGGTPHKHFDVIWASLLGNLFHMMRERLDQDDTTDVSGVNYFGDVSPSSDPTDFRPASTQSNAVTWLSGGRVLMSGTSGGENLINFTGDSLSIKENSNYGSYNSQVVKAGKDVIYIGKDRRSLRTYRYSEDNGSWLSDDLSSKAETLFLDGAILASEFPTIKQISWNSETKHLWVLMSDFTLKVFSYDPEFGLSGWMEFEMGGESTKRILGVTNMPSPDRARIETYIAVERTMPGAAGGTNIYLEKIMGEFNNTSMLAFPSTDLVDFPRYVDFGQLNTADGSGVVDALDPNYVGLTVDCLYFTADSFAYELGVNIIDNSSNPKLDFTFPDDAKVLWGYKYDAEFMTLPPEAGGQFGSAMADIKHIHESYLKLYRTKDFSIGSKDKDSGTDLSFEVVTYEDLETNDKSIDLQNNPDTAGQVIVRSTTPTPLNVLALVNKGQSYD